MDDFPDRLNPILVKEIRQGMRGRVFVGSLVLLQVAMVFLSIFGLTAATAGESTSDFGTVYWVLIGAPLLLVLPISGLGAVAGERTANTLELLFLTRLTARRILIGKWLALMVQAVLLVCAVVPYGVLRYFLGSVSLEQELTNLAAVLLAAAILTAAAVGCSPLPVWVTRVLAVIGTVGAMWVVPAALLTYRFGHSYMVVSGSPSPAHAGVALAAWLLPLLIGAILIALALEFGAGRIAPPSENHSTPIRLLALGSVGLGIVMAFVWPGSMPGPLLLSYMLVRTVSVGVMCENPRLIPSLYRPFVRFGLAGRALGAFLYPGWPSGVVFTVLGGALLLLAGLVSPHTNGFDAIPWLPALVFAWVDLGLVLVPFAFLRLIGPKLRYPFVGYILFQIGTYMLFSISAVVNAISPAADPSPLFKLIPLYGVTVCYSHGEMIPFLGLAEHNSGHCDDLLGAAFTTTIAIVLLLMRIWGPWREMAACERQAATSPAPAA